MNFDIEEIKRRMLVKYPFFGSVVSNVDYVEFFSGYAATNGKTIYYNKEMLENLTFDEQVFIMSHEVCHIAFNHILRSEGKNKKIWNIATDAVVNAYLKQDGLPLVDGGIDMPEAIYYDTEQLYDKLLKDEQEKEKSSNDSNEDSKNQSDNSQDNFGHDDHSIWDDAVKQHHKDENIIKKILSKILGKNKEAKEIEKKQQETMQKGEIESFEQNAKERKQNLVNLKNDLSEYSISPGTTTNSEVLKLDNIGSSKELVDWRYVLKEAVTYDVDWSYQNATIENGVIVPNLEERPMAETEILLDTSGSINVTLLKNFLKECKNILQHSRLKVGCFDTVFYGFTDINDESDIDDMKFVGRGGTDFDIAVNAFTNRVENKIIFTDGEAGMPEKSIDVIWIVFGDRKINPKGGRVVYISQKQFARLCNYETKEKSKVLKKEYF